jgi:plasmid stability protein
MMRRQLAITGDIMANLSIRGLEDKALTQLKKQAAKEASSVNALVLRLIDQSLGRKPSKAVLRRHDDLDALAGRWQKKEGQDFERAVAALGKVDASLWKP